jgi:hypothetical protein
MKRTLLTVLFSALTVASVASIMSRSARAEIIVFTATLLPANDVPPVAVVHPTELGGSGVGVFTLDVTRSGSTITAATARFDATLSGYASNSVVILTHIHQGAAGVNGPVVVDTGISPAAPIPMTNGGVSFTRGVSPAINVNPTLAQSIISNPAGFYFNVHTALSPGGVSRGQLVLQQTTGGLTAPTLSEWGVILMFLLLAAAATFFLVGRRNTILAAVGAEQPAFSAPRTIEWNRFARVLLYVEAVIALTLVALSSFITALDVAGGLVSGVVAAFIVYLMIAAKRR